MRSIRPLQDVCRCGEHFEHFVGLLLDFAAEDCGRSSWDLYVWIRANSYWFAEVRAYLLDVLGEGRTGDAAIEAAEQRAIEAMLIVLEALRVLAEPQDGDPDASDV